jgi:hypothetical protein
MPPAHGKPASFRVAKPSSYRKREQTCQVSTAGSTHAPLGAIFLLNFESPYRENLAITLRNLRLKVFVPEEYGKSLQKMTDAEFRQADLILFDLTRLNHDQVWLPLRRICRLRNPHPMPLMVHCFSRIDRGSDFRLMVEKLGARMDYYAQ